MPLALVRDPSQRSLASSVTPLVNDMSDNEMIPGTVHRSSGIYLIADENPEKPTKAV